MYCIVSFHCVSNQQKRCKVVLEMENWWWGDGGHWWYMTTPNSYLERDTCCTLLPTWSFVPYATHCFSFEVVMAQPLPPSPPPPSNFFFYLNKNINAPPSSLLPSHDIPLLLYTDASCLIIIVAMACFCLGKCCSSHLLFWLLRAASTNLTATCCAGTQSYFETVGIPLQEQQEGEWGKMK